MLEVKNVNKTFGKKNVLKDVNLKVEKMSIHGLIGYNGAGKTTLLKIIAGVYEKDSGEINFCGEPLWDNEKMKQKIFYVPDDIYFRTATTMKKMAKFYEGYYPNFDMNTFNKLSEIFGLNVNAKVNGFSKGMQRQAELILGLSAKPDLLLLDESFDGLDPAKRHLTKDILLEYMAERNASVIISSHNLRELTDMCDHLALMNGNKISLDVSVQEISEQRFKVRLAFKEDVSDDELTLAGLTNIERDGKIITAKINSNADETIKSIELLQPVLFEKIPLTLEEIFLEEMEDKSYDLKEIFS